MNLLKAVLYDPGTAVSKATSSLIAMTAFDTTNLRAAITVPAHGMIYVRIMGGAVTGATTVPTLFLGVMNGATVLARVTPQDFPGTMNAATQSCPLYAEFVITGLTPGAMNLDLAYGVEVVVASTNIKYGGPNDTTTNNAWGGISFQVWDPQPMTANSTLAVDSNGRVDVIKVAGTTQTARDLGASVLLSAGTGTGQLDFTSGVVKANLAQILGTALTETAGQIAAAFKKFFNIATPASTMDALTLVATATNLTNAPTAGDFTATMKTSIGTAVAASAVASVTGNVGGNVVGSVASVTAAVTLPSIPANWITAAGINASALNGKGDWLLSSSYTAPLSAAGTRTAVGLASANLDTQIGGLLTSASYTAPDNTSITAIKAKTDPLTFSVANKLDANTLYVNGVQVTGTGAGATPWGPA